LLLEINAMFDSVNILGTMLVILYIFIIVREREKKGALFKI